MLKQIPGDLKSVLIEESEALDVAEIDLFETDSFLHSLASNHLGDSEKKDGTETGARTNRRGRAPTS